MPKIKSLLFFTSFWFLLCQQAYSNPISGELHYRWVSDSTYEFTFVYYDWCGLGNYCSPPLFLTLDVKSSSLNHSSRIQWALSRLPTSGNMVPPLRPSDLSNCSSIHRDANYPSIGQHCFEEYVYRGNYTLPGRAKDWVFSVDRGCPFYFENISGNYVAAYSECGLNNLDFPDSTAQNISPIWMNRRPSIPGKLSDTLINYPIISACRNRSYILNQSATEYQGDITRYDIAKYGVFGKSSLSFNYKTGYNQTYPLPTDTLPRFDIDSISGEILYKPIRQQPTGPQWTNFYSIPIIVREYRMDTSWIGGNPIVKRKEIGHVTRFIAFVVTPDSLCSDSLNYFVDTLNRTQTSFINLSCHDNPFKIAFNNSIRCNTVDSNASCFVLIHDQTGDTVKLSRAEAVCRLDNIADDIKIYTDSILPQGMYFLYVKTGDDGNSIFTQCGSEIVPFNDTLKVVMNIGPDNPTLLKDSTGADISQIDLECGSKTIILYPSYEVGCNSLKSDGSDFFMVDSAQNPPRIATIQRVMKSTCLNGFISKIEIKFGQAIQDGNYTLYLKKGSDGNTLLDACHRHWPFLETPIHVPEPTIDIGPDIEICSRDSVDIILDLGPGIYGHWSTGEYKSEIHVTEYGIYWVKHTTPLGCLAIDSVNVIEINCTGIEELNKNQIQVYPNPTSGLLQIDLDDRNIDEIQVYNSLGSLVFSEVFPEHKKSLIIQLPDALNDGVYLLKLIGEKGVFTQRVVLRRKRD